ncbi:hypothetical protein K458DRAFT_387276 [Lentithecium fluviatile CBS 122367]|uniref:RING-type domain-containing protein n=1 Tax=Lentithecium fluviatile CBS 122367 TaxID=1168545 RepID=A0A6G1J7T9_9PLEO|nr:hypothetical protein K458DRAFT_387276 [Lentithecium fluviatile CBS 122367]
MANPAADPKAAPLADDQKEYLLSLDPKLFPKNFFCSLCSQLAIDSYKLLCCNKAICSSCQAKLEFPTTCPSCEHSPLEAESCTVNKALRGTMRAWLLKQKKKDEKAASQAATPNVEAAPVPAEVQPTGDVADKPAESTEQELKVEDVPAGEASADNGPQEPRRAGSEASQMQEDTASQANDRVGQAPQDSDQTAEQEMQDGQPQADQSGYGNPMMNGNAMPSQFGFGFNPNQANMNGMGFNSGMNPMSGMPNVMANGAYNMNPMGYGMNNMNGMPGMPPNMYGGFGGNAGMGMNNMSAMGYGGGYGNWGNGMGGAEYGYNGNGYNQMGGYNQSGAYPEMMNRFPNKNYPNNRFQANGGNFPQQRNNRNGSFGGYGQGSGFQNPNSRPGSRGHPPQQVRGFHKLPPIPPKPRSSLPISLNFDSATDKRTPVQHGESPNGTANATAEINNEGEQAKASAEAPSEGKDETTASAKPVSEAGQADAPQKVDSLTEAAENEVKGANESSELNPIQTIETVEADSQDYDQSMVDDGMQYHSQMMNQFPHQPSHMNGPYDNNTGYHQNNFHRGGFNNAYGAATVLTGEPRGVGVEGAPTGPRAMREGRPNTGFSSRANNARFNAPPPSVTPSQEAAPASPVRNIRSRSPERDENLRTKDRSRSASRNGDGGRNDHRERTRSPGRDEHRDGRGRSRTPDGDDYDDDYRKDRRYHRSSRYDDRGEKDDRDDYDDRHREDRDSRGNRTRSTSADSKHRSRRTKEKYRQSRSHRDRSRDRSREHRRRHRSRSNSPAAEDKYEEEDSGSRRKNKSDKDKYRERDRSRDRDRDRDRRDRKERDYDEEKYRSRDKDKEKRRRRDREEEDDRDYDDDKHRSSRRSRKDRDRERDRDYEKEPTSATSTRPVSPPLNAPTGPSADNFSIRGASKPKALKNMPPPQPPTGPRGFQPPKGPSADRDKHQRKSSVSSIPSAPTTPTVQDHYAAEREKNARERDRLDRGGKNLVSRTTTPTSHHSSSRPTLSSKRSRDDFEAKEDVKAAPIAPASHRDKRRKSGAGDKSSGPDLASILTKGLRKSADTGGRRRGGVKTEGDVEKELERVERERDGRRW